MGIADGQLPDDLPGSILAAVIDKQIFKSLFLALLPSRKRSYNASRHADSFETGITIEIILMGIVRYLQALSHISRRRGVGTRVHPNYPYRGFVVIGSILRPLNGWNPKIIYLSWPADIDNRINQSYTKVRPIIRLFSLTIERVT